MTTTELRPADAKPTDLGLSDRVLLITAPLVMALGRVLLVPQDDQGWDEMMTDMAAHRGRSDVGWLLAIGASGLLAITAVILARRLQLAGRNRAATMVIVTTALGWATSAAIGGGALIQSAAAGAPGRDIQVQIMDDFNDSNAIGFLFLATLAAVVGYVVLAVALTRAGLVSKGAGVLIFVGGAATIITMAGPMTPLLVAAALLLAAGHGLALRSLDQAASRSGG